MDFYLTLDPDADGCDILTDVGLNFTLSDILGLPANYTGDWNQIGSLIERFQIGFEYTEGIDVERPWQADDFTFGKSVGEAIAKTIISRECENSGYEIRIPLLNFKDYVQSAGFIEKAKSVLTEQSDIHSIQRTSPDRNIYALDAATETIECLADFQKLEELAEYLIDDGVSVIKRHIESNTRFGFTDTFLIELKI